ncbi:MAG TPA: RDD family protein [Vicinamibacterales bacterium]|nr:RDD family protein [Vicinamibacterales bacterium]
MKCPKCDYVGFEETDRCRHCGYDFSLVAAGAVAGQTVDETAAPSSRALAPTAGVSHRMITPDTIVGITPDDDLLQDLPLRTPSFPALVRESQPLPARTPLAVRRQAADRSRTRSVPQVVRRSSAPLLDTAPDSETACEPESAPIAVAPAGLRLLAALVDLAVLAGIDLAVVYLTAQLAGVPVAAVRTLPLVPLATFLLGLNVAYLAVFTANGGQTLGKMTTGLRVEAVAGGISLAAALVRVSVAVVGGLVAGAGFLPALVRADGRALHDYAAQTRVVRVAK